MIYRLLFLLCLATLFACSPKVTADTAVEKVETTGPVKEVDFGEQATLRQGESLRIGRTDVGFTFTRMMTDSRCPEGLDCIQAGEVILLITFPNGGSQRVRVGADSKQKASFGTADGSFQVLKVSPYPVARQPPVPEDYEMTVKVMKAATM
ncbi:MAG: hypothetical protein ACJAZ9_001839 [Neolewinella sp.]|jgi:hypothetical protein